MHISVVVYEYTYILYCVVYACTPTYIFEVTMRSVTYVRVMFLLTHSSKGHQRSFEEETESERKSKSIGNGNELDGLHLTLAATFIVITSIKLISLFGLTAPRLL